MKNKNIILLNLLLLASIFGHAEDYFWVGGKGTWSQLTSWRFANGQIPNEVPDQYDNVIFNEFSFLQPFDTVFILTQNATCKSMTWENIQDTVVIMGGSITSTLNIHGSLTLHPKIVNYYHGKIFFNSDSQGNTISCAGSRIAYDIYFKGNGEWILQDTLLMMDTMPWRSVIFDFIEPLEPNPILFHENGTLRTNGNTIITRGFSTEGSNPRFIYMANTHVYFAGNWKLNGQNIDFDATNTYINMRGEMRNEAGEVITYHDIDVMGADGAMINNDIRTVMRKVHFMGSGTVDGNFKAGVEGSYTMDTLIFNGAFDMMGNPIPCLVTGPQYNIHYTEVNQVHGLFEQLESFFHRIVYQGDDFGIDQYKSVFKGNGNECDTVQFLKPRAIFAGDNEVNNLLFFKTDGTLSSWNPAESNINHAVFSGDGFIRGSNTIDRLTLNTGFRYEIQTDSLTIPGSAYTNTNIQTINQIEVLGDCYDGLCTFVSDQKLVQAIIDYTGSNYTTEYIQVMDVRNIGTPVKIENGIDLGNTNGFDFLSYLGARNLYWVGGNGHWSDPEHWSLIPGSAPGNQCPPTMLDNAYFNAGSGFNPVDTIHDTVFVNVKHAYCNDMIWGSDVPGDPYFLSAYHLVDSTFDTITQLYVLDTNLVISDSLSLHLWGSLQFNPSMYNYFFGEVYFESQDDGDEWETIDLRNAFIFDEQFEDSTVSMNCKLWNRVYFYGHGGKWDMQSNFYNKVMADTTFFKMGELRLTGDTLICNNFYAGDTLPKGLYLLDNEFLERTLVQVHHFQHDAWTWNAHLMDSVTFFDAGHSTIRAMGNMPPQMDPANNGSCNIVTTGQELTYYNIEFSDPVVTGKSSKLLSNNAKSNYNLVDFYIKYGEVINKGTIDTLTFKVGADSCILKDDYEINFVIAEGSVDHLEGKCVIDSALFYDNGNLAGFLDIGYLEGNKYLEILYKNKIDTAVLYGNADILGHNTFSQLVLSPEKKYFFQHEIEPNPYLLDTTIIIDDWVVNGYCDGPIRIQSDSIGTQAKILYKAQNPTHPDFTAKYTSMRDIRMLDYNGMEYTANSSVNLGNNSNIDFVESSGDIYYWIGGTGDWGDWEHWSYSSGGPAIDERCTPKEINTVVFDNNSFNTPDDIVSVDVVNAYCKSMYWKHSSDYNPTFIGPDTSVLYIYGSLELKENMTYSYRGELLFDQFEEPGDIADTILSRGHIIMNNIRFQGINDVVYLGDDLELFIDPGPPIYKSVFHEHGTLVLNGKHLISGGYFSDYKNNRTLNMENSTATITFTDDERCWIIWGENFQLEAENSTIYNESLLGTMWTEFGDVLEYGNVVLNNLGDSLGNKNNLVSYNVIYANKLLGTICGNFLADTIYLRGTRSQITQKSTTNVIYLDSSRCSINNKHIINECYVNKFGYINGTNEIKYCQFLASGVFTGHNVFETLILYPGQGNFENQGNTFFFEADSTQVVLDSLYLRGNQCSNITITSQPPSKLAYIRKDNGYDLSSDYLYIYNVSAVSENDNIKFYAGINSTALPDETNPPPGWIFDNQQGYIPGFNGRTDRFCLNEEYVINANNFNGDPFTQYYWEGSQYPGDITYTVNEPGIYSIRVQYFEGCYVEDFINIEGDFPPVAKIAEGPFCEGDEISVAISPPDGSYSYLWWNGDTTPTVLADLNYSGGIKVLVTDTDNNCKNEPNETILVKPTPYPQVYLGTEEEWIDFGETIILDAGPGTSYHWEADPPIVTIDNPDQQTISASAIADIPILYTAFVDLNGCGNEGKKLLLMYPQKKLGVPTAFSPNGDIINDILYVEGSGFEDLVFQIYNRYGELVFESTDKNIGWDGKVNGFEQEMEVYTYYVKVRYVDGGVVEEKGNVTLLR